MPWYDALKKLFNLPKLQGLIVVNINSNNQSKKVEIDSSNTLNVNLDKLNPTEKEQIKLILHDAIEENVILLQDKSKKAIEDFNVIDQSTEIQSILSFLRPLIPSSDIIIWREALYLRKHFLDENHTDVMRLKMEICQKFGDRGKNIANLCTASYLEDYLIPFHEELSASLQNDKEIKEKFGAIYSNIVENLPFTIFVGRQTKEEEIGKNILDKMEQNLKYGLKFFNIHGIGKNNVNKIKETVTEIEEKDILQNKAITEENNIIFVRLEFK
ncbi:MAG: hypothetical protein V1871_03440 [Planctomycetota bacterium]